MSLATADLIVGCFVMPIAGIYAIMEKWNMGKVSLDYVTYEEFYKRKNIVWGKRFCEIFFLKIFDRRNNT